MQYGHFDNEKREYVIDRVDLPASWTNYLGLKDMCAVVNHTAGGYMFYKTPEYHRITRFRGNSIPMDRPGHYVYIRDNSDGDYWSISWQPVGKSLEEAAYRCGGGKIPVQLYGDFRENRISTGFGAVTPQFEGQFAFGNLRRCCRNSRKVRAGR